MRKTSILAMTMLCVLIAHSQSLHTRWITTQQADSTSEIWFRQRIQLRELPVLTSVTIAIMGKVDVYINERNVSTVNWMPYRMGNDNLPVSTDMEVTRFL